MRISNFIYVTFSGT